MTGSNQTLLYENVRQSLAGRASYFDFNTLSLHELLHSQSKLDASLDNALFERMLEALLFRGGWPELWTNPDISIERYLNDLL